jgi:polyisoprenoid-binding protein YceI
MIRKFRRYGLPGLLLCAGSLAFAQASAQPDSTPGPKQITVHFDSSQTRILWTLRDLLHTVHGTFQLKGGVLTFDSATGAAEGELLVDLDSGDSGDKTRDRLMKKNVLETTTYPEAIYHPEKISGSLKPGSVQQLTIDGTFTIHGKDHPLQLVASAQMTDPTHVTATAHFVVPYVAWGMKDPSTFLLRVGKQVEVDVKAQGTVEGLQ